ncbi:MAG: hypothetical protein GF344_13380 [Chitinivibrionales bacterium]|nr:hypothetical protein [Chitinivibrionales bacterium]MBD3357722.1 hypothetical protein [Chitinivibrionales bacterium]
MKKHGNEKLIAQLQSFVQDARHMIDQKNKLFNRLGITEADVAGITSNPNIPASVREKVETDMKAWKSGLRRELLAEQAQYHDFLRSQVDDMKKTISHFDNEREKRLGSMSNQTVS